MSMYRLPGLIPSLPPDGSVWIAPSADVIGNVRLARDVSIWFGAVVRADNTPVVIGEGTNIQDHAILHSDPGFALEIGAGCIVGHRAILHGCLIGDGVLVGMGAIAMNGACIGEGCVIGAGALITEGKTFAPGTLLLGSPARAAGEVPNALRTSIRASARDYIARATLYAADMKRSDSF